MQHLTSYPVVSESITTFKSNPYGARSINLADTVHTKLVKPVVPYAQKPYGYISPYVARADQIAASGLDKVDARFPIIKEDTEKIKGTVVGYAYAPFVFVGKGKEYLTNTYGSEYKKCGGPGYMAGGKAIVTTGLIVTSDVLGWVGSFIAEKKVQGEQAVKDKTSS